LLYRTSDYIHAAQTYGELAQTGALRSSSLWPSPRRHRAEEMAGHYPQALPAGETLSSVIRSLPDGPMYICQARYIELTGSPASASALYDRFVILYPQSPWNGSRERRAARRSPAHEEGLPNPLKFS